MQVLNQLMHVQALTYFVLLLAIEFSQKKKFRILKHANAGQNYLSEQIL